MLKKFTDSIKNASKKVKIFALTCVCIVGSAVPAFADETQSSLLDASVKSTLQTTAGQIVPTVMDILTIVVPVGIACWAIGFGVKKGIGYLKKQAGRAL